MSALSHSDSWLTTAAKTNQDSGLQALRSYAIRQTSSFKVPRYVRFVDEWPMSATKIQKHRLRESLLAELGAA